jgi:hypothetical protein
VLPAQLFATPFEPIEVPSVLPAGSFDAMPVVEAIEPVEARASQAIEPVVEPAVEPAIAAVEPAVATAVEPIVASEPGKKKRGRRGGKGRNKRADAGISRELLATDMPASATSVVPTIDDVAVTAEISAPADALAPSEQISAPAIEAAPIAEPVIDLWAAPMMTPMASPTTSRTTAPTVEPIATETWAPTMPPAAPSVPWRRPAYAAVPTVIVPSLVIDDADPDSAERVLEERAEAVTPRRSFLPPILLDREDRSARQGGLTLAVIILLIAATLTLSYLMRRPSASGDGMTRLETPASYVG